LSNNVPLLFPAIDLKTGEQSVETLKIGTVSFGRKEDSPRNATIVFNAQKNARSFDGVYYPDNDPAKTVAIQVTARAAEKHNIYVEDCEGLDGNVFHIWYIVPLQEFIEFKKTWKPGLTPTFVPNDVFNFTDWEAKVVCIDDFHSIASAICQVPGVGAEKTADILEWLLQEQQFLKPLNELTDEDWQNIDGIGPDIATKLSAQCESLLSTPFGSDGAFQSRRLFSGDALNSIITLPLLGL